MPLWERVVPSGVPPTAVAAIGGAVLLVAGGTLAFLERSDTRPGWLFRGSLSPREDAWESGLDMWGDHVITGAGPNTFGLLYPEYSGEFLVHAARAQRLRWPTTRAIGVLALAVLAVSVGYVLVTWRDGTLSSVCSLSPVRRSWALGAGLDASNIWMAPGIALAIVGRSLCPHRERAFPRPPSALRPAFAGTAGRLVAARRWPSRRSCRGCASMGAQALLARDGQWAERGTGIDELGGR
jgi:hypothetical protein